MNYPAEFLLPGGSARLRTLSSPGDLQPRSFYTKTAASRKWVNVTSRLALLTDLLIERLTGFLNSFALVKHRQEPASVFVVLRYPTRPFVCSVIHGPNKAWRSKHGVQGKSASGA